MSAISIDACLRVVQCCAKLLSGAISKYHNDIKCRQQNSDTSTKQKRLLV